MAELYHKIYVTNSNNDSVSVINETTNEIIKNITVGNHPSLIAIGDFNEKVYVLNQNYMNMLVNGLEKRL